MKAGVTWAAEETPVTAGDSDTASLAVMAAQENTVQGFTHSTSLFPSFPVSAGSIVGRRQPEVVSPFDTCTGQSRYVEGMETAESNVVSPSLTEGTSSQIDRSQRDSGGPPSRGDDQFQKLEALPFSELEVVFRCSDLSNFKFQQLVTEAFQFQKHFLQLGVSLMQLLLSCPKEGTWIKTFVRQLQHDKKLSPARRDLLPLGCLPPVGAVLSLVPRFPFEVSGMIRCDISCLNSMGRQQRKTLLQACCMQVWRLLVILVLNGESIDWNSNKVFRQHAPTGPQDQMISRVTTFVNRFCTTPGSTSDIPDFHELVKSKTIDYNGEECGHALPLKLDELRPGLPPLGVAGTLEAHAVAGPDVRRWLEDPSRALKPVSEWPQAVPQTKINATRQEWEKLCGTLFELGIIAPIAASDVFEVDGVKVLNGAFAVLKKGGQSRVTRLIMNHLLGAPSFSKTTRSCFGPQMTSVVPSMHGVCLQLGGVL